MAYSSETCETYTLNFGTTNDFILGSYSTPNVFSGTAIFLLF